MSARVSKNTPFLRHSPLWHVEIITHHVLTGMFQTTITAQVSSTHGTA